MNLGGEPDRDDFGLPPVDIEIPDDARELDRDVQAYRREQRALRRRLRRSRLRGPLAGDGMIMPLLAGSLVFALIAAVLLTVFTASGDVVPGGQAPRSLPSSPAAASSVPAGTPVIPTARHLPHKTIAVVGGRKLALGALTTAALALVPTSCVCTSALRQLITQAAQAGVPLYLVGADAAVTKLRRIATATARPSRPVVADDHQNVLTARFETGLTVILVHSDRSLGLAQDLEPGLRLKDKLLGLKQPGA